MDRRDFLVNSSQAALGAAFVSQTRNLSASAEPQPNMIWLLADQWRAQAVGCNGDPNVETPNTDRLATTGVNFVQARAGFPLCCPARGTILTSRYPNHMIPGYGLPYRLPQGQPTIATAFNNAGYHTGYFGKWHVDGSDFPGDKRPDFHIIPPNRRGDFETWIGFEYSNNPFDTYVHGGETPEEAFPPRKLPGYQTDGLTDLFIKYIKARVTEQKTGHGKPFFGVLSVEPPHQPRVAPANVERRFNAEKLQLRPNVPMIPSFTEHVRQDLAHYYAQIENWDWNIGRIIDVLTQEGILTNTHIMIFADHGDSLGSHGQLMKENPYEEAGRIPMIVSGYHSYFGYNSDTWVDVSNDPFAQVDIAPTALGLCNIDAPAWMEGYDFSSRRIRSRKPLAPAPDSLYLQQVKPSMHPDTFDVPYRGLVTRDGWKYVCLPNQSWFMFNLNEDPYEQQNLAYNLKYKVERARLIARLKQWVADTKDDFIVPSV